jgi:acyl-CoA reductase-like NAD-dependent aldehyde dehydrogenase
MADLTVDIRRLVTQVLGSPEIASLLHGAGESRDSLAPAAVLTGRGVFHDVDSAVAAVAAAQRKLAEIPLERRRAMIAAMRRGVLDANESLSAEAVAETGLGNVPDKMAKNALAVEKTPGVEDVEPAACSDEHGLTLTERAPYGVIAAITPVTNPIATIASNSIGMIAAGNSVVFNVHPSAKRISNRLVGILNDAITGEGGPADLLCSVASPTIKSANALMRHPGVGLLVVTGGPAVVREAMASGKKAICAGPGNPPCVVDQTADVSKAGRDIVAGAGFDYNVVCICEKEVLAVASIADSLKDAMRKNGAYELTGPQIEAVTKLVLADPGGPDREGAPNKEYVGKSPRSIAHAAGIDVPPETRLLLMEVGRNHPLVWTEQLMPVLPLVRMATADEAIDFAVLVERGNRHTAIMHSHDIQNLSRMARLMNCSIFVKNGPCYAGLGKGGAGYTSFTIASPTGEGVTRARTFTRERRCTLVDHFRIV